jgi:hypothetical protein
MWEFNNDLLSWSLKKDQISMDDFNQSKEELEKTRLYSKCLDGSLYFRETDLNNTLSNLKWLDTETWFISPTSSTYSISGTESSGEIISPDTFTHFSNYISENGFSERGSFSPNKAIEDTNNWLSVDLTTTTEIENINNTFNTLVIDGLEVREGQTILVKDQKTFIGLSASVDVSIFEDEYFLILDNIINKEYFYYNQENGIYVFRNKRLVKQSLFTDYESSKKTLIYCKSGVRNFDKKFSIKRKNNGFYPIETQNIQFVEVDSYITKNAVNYNNLFEVSYNDSIKSSTQSIFVDNFTHSVPERILSVGDFGTILNYQGTYSYTLFNEKSNNLKSIDQTQKYYWICGDVGSLIRLDKLTLEVEHFKIDTLRNLTSISFYSDSFGCVVGEFGEIWITSNGGFEWRRIEVESLLDTKLTKVLYKYIDKIWISGNNGTLLELNLNSNIWQIKKIAIKKVEEGDSFDILDNITDFIWISTSSWTITGQTKVNKEFLLLSTSAGDLVVYNLNNFINYSFLFFDFKDLKYSISSITLGNSNNIYVSSESVYYFDYTDFNFTNTEENILHTTSSKTEVINLSLNKLRDFNNAELLLSGKNSYSKLLNYSSLSSFIDLSEPFLNILKSRFLILDYDIASKVNWFDVDGEYRLPSTASFTQSLVATFSFQINNNNSDDNWLDYWKDSLKTFTYFSDLSESNKVEISTGFSYSTWPTSFTFSSSDFDTNENNLLSLAPTINSLTQSAYLDNGLTLSAPGSTYSIWIKNYLLIFKVGQNNLFKLGDVVNISSQTINANLIVNKILASGIDRYIYCYTDFNNEIIEDLKLNGFSVKNLNTFNNISDLEQRFNLHPVSIGYEMSLVSNQVLIAPKLNNFTSYYNMEISVISNSIKISECLYPESFYRFGFTPNYNILEFLSNIDSSFVSSKEFKSMPKYSLIPAIDTSPLEADPNKISIDDLVSSNKILFGENLKFEWNTFWTNTFVDINISTNIGTFTNQKLLIIDKYFDEELDGYILEFDKKINISSSSITSVDILSRSTLSEISDDLNDLNNISRSQIVKTVDGFTFSAYSDGIKERFSTESYSKILLSDSDIKKNITSIIYTDFSGVIKNNLVNFTEKIEANILTVSDNSGKAQLLVDRNINLIVGELVLVKFDSNLNGLFFIKSIESNVLFTIDLDYSVEFLSGVVYLDKKDPSLYLSPSDLLPLGQDNVISNAIEIDNINYELTGLTYSLPIIDFTKFRFRFVGGLNYNQMISKYPWLLESDVSSSLVGEDKNGFVFYSGIWKCGRWFGGTWYSGEWISGDWYGGIWNSNFIQYSNNNILIDTRSSDIKSKWFSGRWYDGIWNGGTFQSGKWYSGTWNGGIWNGGIWNNGTWNSGVFKGGIWINGIWNSGIFNRDNSESYWLDGIFRGGDFQNGRWFNGEFNEYNGESTFGSLSSGSKKSVWENGNWVSGKFYSGRRLNASALDLVSDVHKWSLFKSGTWNSGQFWGGILFNADVNSIDFKGGIVDDIQVIGASFSGANNQILLNGSFRIKESDEIIISDLSGTGTYSVLFEKLNPIYYVVDSVDLLDDNTTLISIIGDFSTYSLPTIWSSDTGLRVISKFKNATFSSGTWYNGLFESGKFNGGIWYDGVFKGIWGI